MKASFRDSPPFPDGAKVARSNVTLRENLRSATSTIRSRRNSAIEELADFEELRLSAEALKNEALENLSDRLVQLEEAVVRAGGVVHFARDARSAREIVVGLVRETGERDVVKVKSMTTAEIDLNSALEAAGIGVKETDLAELIVQLGGDLPSHIVVPAIHRNRSEIRDIFVSEMKKSGRAAPEGLSDSPKELAAAAREHLRERFMRSRVAISGANFAIAETGSLVVVESEGNGRMCLTLADTLISVVGIDKVLSRFQDLEVFLQLLPRSATGERMNPYTSIWTGVTPGDGPSAFHLVLLDNGRSEALADPIGSQVLRCIRCAACLNVCPVYEQVGGHAYGSVYPGPIGAVLTPQLKEVGTDAVNDSLPFASTLCGACFEVCPVRIDIPRLLVHLRAKVVEAKAPSVESVAMSSVAWIMATPKRFDLATGLLSTVSKLLPKGSRLHRLPGLLKGWSSSRDAPVPAPQSFRKWWSTRDRVGASDADQAPSLADRTRATPRGNPDLDRSGVLGGPHVEPPLAEHVTERLQVLRSIDASRTPRASQPSTFVQPHIRAGQRMVPDPVQLFGERLRGYDAKVRYVEPADVPASLSEILTTHGVSSLAVPDDLPEPWLRGVSGDANLDLHRDAPHLERDRLKDVEGTLTCCALAIAETGTIILDGGRGQGRRLLSLLPDLLIVVVSSRQIVDGVPDAVSRIDPRLPQTWISGPSATSDIELSRVEGVHGPRVLEVLVVDEDDDTLSA